jgi:hypothetical protein
MSTADPLSVYPPVYTRVRSRRAPPPCGAFCPYLEFLPNCTCISTARPAFCSFEYIPRAQQLCLLHASLPAPAHCLAGAANRIPERMPTSCHQSLQLGTITQCKCTVNCLCRACVKLQVAAPAAGGSLSHPYAAAFPLAIAGSRFEAPPFSQCDIVQFQLRSRSQPSRCPCSDNGAQNQFLLSTGDGASRRQRRGPGLQTATCGVVLRGPGTTLATLMTRRAGRIARERRHPDPPPSPRSHYRSFTRPRPPYTSYSGARHRPTALQRRACARRLRDSCVPHR